MSLQTNKFKKKGFIKIKKFFSKKLINKILEEVSNSENTDIYFDRNGNLRRIERLFDKGKNLKFYLKFPRWSANHRTFHILAQASYGIND